MMRHMRRLFVLVALLAGGCGGSSSPVAPAPAPIPTASIVRSGNLVIDMCFALGGGLFSCGYHGVGENIGAGCGASVSGVTKSFMPNENTALDSNQWTYGATVRPHEQFVYRGSGLRVPSADGWTYSTAFTWTDIRCP